MNLEKVEKAARALLGMKSPGHVQPKSPTKKDLKRKFKMELDDKDKPSVKEIS